MMILPYFSDQSKVWIYYSHRNLNRDDLNYIQTKLTEFCKQWQAHQQNLKSSFVILHERFLAIVVDENPVSASGCSIDKSVNELKKIGSELSINFFERNSQFYFQNNELIEIKLNELQSLYENNVINYDTLFIDTTVNHLRALRNEFVKKLKDSWLTKKLKTIHT